MTALLNVLTILSPDERTRKHELEEQAYVGIRASVLGAQALRKLRDERLYRGTHASFEAYGVETFGLTRARLYQLIDFAGIAQEAAAFGIEVSTERMARALGVVPPDDYQLVIDVAKATTGKGTLSSADVQGVADTVRHMAAGMVEHPDTQQPVPFKSLPPERKAEAVTKAVQRGSQDRRDFQGVDDVKPLDWLDGLRSLAEVALIGSADGWHVEVTDRSNGENRSGPTKKSVWDAIRAARVAWEGEINHDDAE